MATANVSTASTSSECIGSQNDVIFKPADTLKQLKALEEKAKEEQMSIKCCDGLPPFVKRTKRGWISCYGPYHRAQSFSSMYLASELIRKEIHFIDSTWTHTANKRVFHKMYAQ